MSISNYETGALYFCTGIFIVLLIASSNILTMIVILKNPRLATASNQFILGLACADLLVIQYHIIPKFA